MSKAFGEGDWCELCTFLDGQARQIELSEVQYAVVEALLGLSGPEPFSDDALVANVLPAVISATSGRIGEERE